MKELLKKKISNKGFTLVELIIVVAIIAVLAAVLAPQYLQYVERSREANDIQVATLLMEAAIVAVTDPQNSAIIPSRYYVFEWKTASDIENLANNSAVSMGVGTRASSGGVNVTNLWSFNYEGDDPSWGVAEHTFARDICDVMGWTETFGNSADPVNVSDAESKAGNEMNFRFAVNAETTEVIILNESNAYDSDNPWIEKLGLKSATM